MAIIYKHTNPNFTLSKDPHQWILEREGRYRTYHPKLSGALEELAEYYFRKFSKKLKTLEDLELAIDRVYDLLEKVSVKLPDKI